MNIKFIFISILVICTSAQEVKWEPASADVIVRLHGAFYNISAFVSEHPGGSMVLHSVNGQEVEEYLEGRKCVHGICHQHQHAYEVLAKFAVPMEEIVRTGPKFYNITSFVAHHPGGPLVLRSVNGQDVTEYLQGRKCILGACHQHHNAQEVLDQLEISGPKHSSPLPKTPNSINPGAKPKTRQMVVVDGEANGNQKGKTQNQVKPDRREKQEKLHGFSLDNEGGTRKHSSPISGGEIRVDGNTSSGENELHQKREEQQNQNKNETRIMAETINKTRIMAKEKKNSKNKMPKLGRQLQRVTSNGTVHQQNPQHNKATETATQNNSKMQEKTEQPPKAQNEDEKQQIIPTQNQQQENADEEVHQQQQQESAEHLMPIPIPIRPQQPFGDSGQDPRDASCLFVKRAENSPFYECA